MLTQWSEIKGIVGTCALPMTLHRAPAINTVDPFGDTLLYKAANLVFEVPWCSYHIIACSDFITRGRSRPTTTLQR